MGRLFAISGHSGAGKTSIMREVMGVEREVVSHTTRPMREGEIDGVDYHFINQAEFDYLDSINELAEKTTYFGSASYAVTKTEINNKLAKGDAYIIVDFNGMQQLKEIYPDLVSIFIFTSAEVATERMKKRGDSDGNITKRMFTYYTEVQSIWKYDFAIRNTDRYDTEEVIAKIISLYQ